jgi:hypothetical protein
MFANVMARGIASEAAAAFAGAPPRSPRRS